MSELEEKMNEGDCHPTPKPPLPPGAGPNAYFKWNKSTCEWDYNDPHVAEEEDGN